jgi:hypothetical protein
MEKNINEKLRKKDNWRFYSRIQKPHLLVPKERRTCTNFGFIHRGDTVEYTHAKNVKSTSTQQLRVKLTNKYAPPLRWRWTRKGENSYLFEEKPLSPPAQNRKVFVFKCVKNKLRMNDVFDAFESRLCSKTTKKTQRFLCFSHYLHIILLRLVIESRARTVEYGMRRWRVWRSN